MIKVYQLSFSVEVAIFMKYLVCEAKQIPSFGEIRKFLDIKEMTNARMLSFEDALSVLHTGNYTVYPPA